MSETILEFQARAERALARHDAKKDRQLARARRCIAGLRAQLTEERLRMREMLAQLERTLEEERDKGACRSHYVAIVAMLRAKRAAEGEQ